MYIFFFGKRYKIANFLPNLWQMGLEKIADYICFCICDLNTNRNATLDPSAFQYHTIHTEWSDHEWETIVYSLAERLRKLGKLASSTRI